MDSAEISLDETDHLMDLINDTGIGDEPPQFKTPPPIQHFDLMVNNAVIDTIESKLDNANKNLIPSAENSTQNQNVDLSEQGMYENLRRTEKSWRKICPKFSELEFCKNRPEK